MVDVETLDMMGQLACLCDGSTSHRSFKANTHTEYDH